MLALVLHHPEDVQIFEKGPTKSGRLVARDRLLAAGQDLMDTMKASANVQALS